MECLLTHGSDSQIEINIPLPERVRLIDETVETFAAHLRNVLVRCVKPDLTWNRDYGIGEWSDPMDTFAAAYGPGIWYAMRSERGRLVGRDEEE
jgi:hypothetical protein